MIITPNTPRLGPCTAPPTPNALRLGPRTAPSIPISHKQRQHLLRLLKKRFAALLERYFSLEGNTFNYWDGRIITIIDVDGDVIMKDAVRIMEMEMEID